MFSETPVNEQFNNPFFIAKVIENNDPIYAYRVKVKIDRLHDDIADENLPWAAKLDSSFLGIPDMQKSDDGEETKSNNNTETFIKHSVPEIGSYVLVLCIANDPNSLVYLGTLYRKIDSITPEKETKFGNKQSNDPYHNTWGIYGKHDGKDIFLGLDKINKVFQLLLNETLDIDIDNAKNITITAKENITVTCNSASITATNNVEVTSKEGNITAKCKNMNITANMTTINGPLHVTKDITADANIKAKTEVTAQGETVKLSTHKHKYNPGPGSSIDTAPGKG